MKRNIISSRLAKGLLPSKPKIERTCQRIRKEQRQTMAQNFNMQNFGNQNIREQPFGNRNIGN